jgi:hypothetical protein
VKGNLSFAAVHEPALTNISLRTSGGISQNLVLLLTVHEPAGNLVLLSRRPVIHRATHLSSGPSWNRSILTTNHISSLYGNRTASIDDLLKPIRISFVNLDATSKLLSTGVHIREIPKGQVVKIAVHTPTAKKWFIKIKITHIWQ